MQTVVIVSDTHVPSRAPEIPDFAANEMEDADLVIHAGDFDSREAYETVRDLADDLVAVHGNTDPRGLQLPAVETVWVEDVQFVVTHGTGRLAGYDDRVAEKIRGARDDPDAVGVCGHTHELRDWTVGDVRLLNPGSATGAEPADSASLLLVDVEGEDADVTPRWE
ncbi:metallophosphoesterase family protein [Halobacterium litoreum]|uniref:Phosphoesterase n=1 Tax=Halobacterium litoreum TaxID=2039234 RepID=A0ABD5NFH1_9EURY|nr:YfcE family phosphodiesterase [Halobacterium litoreum]UHH13059.1 YfcE family phosphodiesterase [Halobacterium litoreum]